MTITATAPAPPTDAAAARRPRWERWVGFGVVVLSVVGGLTAFLLLRAHYRDAPPLTCACAVVWAEPDAAYSRTVQAGPWSAAVVPARPGHTQAFEVELVNRSSVTQTIVGGDHNDGQSVEPVDVTFARATGSVLGDQDAKSASDFSASTAVLPPGGVRWVRYAIHTAGVGLWTSGRTEYFTTLNMKVRIGAWTRWQHVDLDNFAFVLSGK